MYAQHKLQFFNGMIRNACICMVYNISTYMYSVFNLYIQRSIKKHINITDYSFILLEKIPYSYLFVA